MHKMHLNLQRCKNQTSTNYNNNVGLLDFILYVIKVCVGLFYSILSIHH